MLVYPSIFHRANSLEAIVRQALLLGELSTRAAQTVEGISQEADISEDELRMVQILQDALGRGYVERRG
ncbi:MAG: hypothetical protein KGQ93_14090 [Cyanobacteria bacterium REEB459]|nr:hypothetical protein [Cyanobacteria bacterium REEB459]